MAYIQKKPVLVKKIEELETNTDKEYSIKNPPVDLDTAIYYNKPWTYFVLLTCSIKVLWKRL